MTHYFECVRNGNAAVKVDIAEAGRELGRFDARPWLADVLVPSAVVLTRRDKAVPPRWQR